MTIRVALHHKTHYRFDRPVTLMPHEIRLRPAVHCRTPIHSYSLTVAPEKHFINWQQDAYGNYLARLVFPEKCRELVVTVDLLADLTVINPFDFFVEQYAEKYPFRYPDRLANELAPYLEREPAGPLLQAWLDRFGRDGFKPGMNVSDFLVNVNGTLQRHIAYLVRMEPGVQACDETLEKLSGSCRDSSWLLVQILRHLGLAARFVSGYLIQLTADVKPLEGPAGTSHDFTDLHAWAEVYVPGAGWIGLDPTSGLFAGEGHIPLACTAFPSSAAPITGATEACESTLAFEMSVTRIHEDPRVTKPYTEEQWSAIEAIGFKVDAELEAADVRLTQGGEPTFVSIDDMDGPEWNYTALSPKKWSLAQALAERLLQRFAPGGLLQFSQGKWYPGEPLPRWAMAILWRPDGKPLWQNPALMAPPAPADASVRKVAEQQAREFGAKLAGRLGLASSYLIPAYENVWLAVKEEQELPVNLDPLSLDLTQAEERAWLARTLARGLGAVTGYVLPLKAAHAEGRRPEAGAREASVWETSVWPLKREHLYLLPGDSPLGYRLPLASLPKVLPEEVEPEFATDPFAARENLHDAHVASEKIRHQPKVKPKPKPKEVVRTALCLQVQEGVLSVFLPPVPRLEDFVNLIAAVENTAAALSLPVRITGYAPPFDPRLRVLSVTPDPGVIEVNIHPARTWRELVANTTLLYEEARQARLGTEKFMLDGRHTGTGGGNHVTLGGATPADSPILRRPDLLQSLITYWQNHPALSYLFSGQFIGPTSQAPRVDEARDANLYELEIAFQQLAQHLPARAEAERPWMVDRLLRHLLTDLTGNTHRAEFSIDKLYSPDSPTGRLGLVEFRAFEMPPHARMSLTQVLLLRALVARFWKTPYRGRLVHWGTQLHDRWMLPHFIAQDMADVVRDLAAADYPFRFDWFAPFIEFRFPRYGTVAYEGVRLELRQAIEPWNVLGEEMQAGTTSRYVDSSVERLQVKINGMTDVRHVVTCNGRPLPLHPTGTQGEFVAGVRYRAWAPPSALHPTIAVHSPLVFDIVDTWSDGGKSIGGCTYHVVHPGGRNYDSFPVNANEAEARRFARFWDHGHTPGAMRVVAEPLNRNFPFTLDLRWRAD